MEFADGSLDPGKEDTLFLMLSSDDELRQQFKSMMSIKNAVRSGVGNVANPESSKAAVFAALSLPLPNASRSPLSWFTKENLALASSVAVFIAALLVFFNIDNNNVNIAENTVKHKNKIVKEKSFVSAENDLAEPPKVIAKEIPAAVNNVTENNVAPSENTDDDDLTIKLSENTLETDDTDIDLAESRIVNIGKNAGIFDNIQAQTQSDLQIHNDYNPMSEGVLLKGNEKLTIEFRGSSYKNTKTPTIEPSKYSPLNNMAIALAYNLNSNISTGIDLRQETFFLRYEGTNNGEQFIYEQQPNFTTFSATLKYKLDGWGGFRPFTQVSAGLNSVGFVGRAMLGAEYRIFSNFAFVLSLDYSNLTYTHQNNYFNSSKFGLNYGLSYSF